MSRQQRPAPKDLVVGDWPDGRPIDPDSGVALLQAFVRRIRRATGGMSARAIGEAVGVYGSTINRVLFVGSAWPDWYTWTQLELKFGVLAPDAAQAGAQFALEHGITRDAAMGVLDRSIRAAHADDPISLGAYTIGAAILDGLREALGPQCVLDYRLPANALYKMENEHPFDPAVELHVDLYDPRRHLAVHFVHMSQSRTASHIQKFHEVYRALGTLDAIQMQYDEQPPARAILIGTLPPLYWRSLALHTGTNIIYPYRELDYSRFCDVWQKIFVDSPDTTYQGEPVAEPGH